MFFVMKCLSSFDSSLLFRWRFTSVWETNSSIASASSYTDSFIYGQCGDEVFSSDLFANMLLARDPDQEGPTLTLGSAAVDGNVSDLEE